MEICRRYSDINLTLGKAKMSIEGRLISAFNTLVLDDLVIADEEARDIADLMPSPVSEWFKSKKIVVAFKSMIKWH